MKRPFKRQRNRGATLLLVLVILVLAVTLASRRVLENTTARLAGAGIAFRTEGLWIAEGVAAQWAQASISPTASTDTLSMAGHWSVGRYEIDIAPRSSQDKIHVGYVPAKDWIAFYRQRCNIQLVEDPDKAVTQRGSGALDMLLDPKYLSGQDAYVGDPSQTVPADLLTVWGSGKIDLNHCSREIMGIRLHGFTDAQISGIERIRTEAAIVRLDHLAESISLTEHQKDVLGEAATLQPEVFELIIRIRKGVLSSVYHAAVSVGQQPRVLEVRSVE